MFPIMKVVFPKCESFFAFSWLLWSSLWTSLCYCVLFLNPTILFMGFSFSVKSFRYHISMSVSTTIFYFLKFSWSEKPDRNGWNYVQNENKQFLILSWRTLLTFFWCYKTSLWKHISMCLFFWSLLNIFLFSVLNWDFS